MNYRLEGGRTVLAVITAVALALSMFALAAMPVNAAHIPATGGIPSNCVGFDAGEIDSQSPADFSGVTIGVESWDDSEEDPHQVSFTVSGLTGNQFVDISLKAGTSVMEDGPYGNGSHTVLTVGQNAISHIRLCVFSEVHPDKGKIIVKKEVTEGSDTTVVFDFTADYDEDGFGLSDGDQNDSGEMEPGTYSVSETVPDGWILVSVVCESDSTDAVIDESDISLSGGETVTCTFVNREIPETTEPPTTPTTAPESTTSSVPLDILPTSIVSTTTVVVSPTDETLPFTGADNGTQAALALVLMAGGALALVGARVFRAGTDE